MAINNEMGVKQGREGGKESKKRRREDFFIVFFASPNHSR